MLQLVNLGEGYTVILHTIFVYFFIFCNYFIKKKLKR